MQADDPSDVKDDSARVEGVLTPAGAPAGGLQERSPQCKSGFAIQNSL